MSLRVPPATVVAPDPVALPASQPSRGARPQNSPPSSKPASTAGFAVQVGAFSTEAAAHELVSKLRASGYDVYLTPAAASSDGRWRVRVGPVPQRARADELALRLEREQKLPTWVLSEEGA